MRTWALATVLAVGLELVATVMGQPNEPGKETKRGEAGPNKVLSVGEQNPAGSKQVQGDLLDRVQDAEFEVELLRTEVATLKGNLRANNEGYSSRKFGGYSSEELNASLKEIQTIRETIKDVNRQLRSEEVRLAELKKQARRAAEKPQTAHAEPTGDRAKLRARIVKVRTKVELLQLRHEADRAALLGLMKAERPLELAAGEDIKKHGDALRPVIDRKTKEFEELTKELNEKTLELEDLDSQQREVKR